MEKSVEKSEGANYRGVSWFFLIQKVTREDTSNEYFYGVILCFKDGDVELDLMPFVWEQKTLFGVDENSGFPDNRYALMRDWAQGFAEAGIDQKLDGNEPETIIIARDETTAKKTQWRPRTKPTQRQQLAMKKTVKKLVDLVGEERLSEIAEVSNVTVRTWKHRGFVSAWMAIKLEKIPALARLGFTKETLRPDITDWPLEEI